MELPTREEIEEIIYFFDILHPEDKFDSFFQPLKRSVILQSNQIKETIFLFRDLRAKVVKNYLYVNHNLPLILKDLSQLKQTILQIRIGYLKLKDDPKNYILDEEDYERLIFELSEIILKLHLKELIAIRKYFTYQDYKKPLLKKSNIQIKSFFKKILELESLTILEGKLLDAKNYIAAPITYFLETLIPIKRLEMATKNYLHYFYLTKTHERLIEGINILFVDKEILLSPWAKTGLSPAINSTKDGIIIIGKVPEKLIDAIIEHEVIEMLTESHEEGVRAEEKKALELGVMQDLIKYRKKLDSLGITLP